MKCPARIAALAFCLFVAAIPLTRPVGAEPLLVIFQFTQAAYSDVTGNEIVVTIRRTDQDPATSNEQFRGRMQARRRRCSGESGLAHKLRW